MKVRAKIKFRDLKEKVIREIGDEFEVTKARYEEIKEKGGDWLEIIEEPAKKKPRKGK